MRVLERPRQMLNMGAAERPFGVAGASGAVTPTDPFWANVVLLVGNNNGADGTTTFTDQSSAARTMTAVGNMQWDTAFAPTGMTSSGLSDGTGDRLTAAASADFTFTGDLTWECFAYRANATGNDSIINIGALDQFVWYFDTSGRSNYFSGSNSLLGAAALASATWTHIALVRSGTTLTSYVGGVAGSTPATIAGTIGGNLALTMFDDLGGATWNGNLCSIRMTSAARYTANFTPPTLPLPTS